MVSDYLSFKYSSRGVESRLNYSNSNGIPISLSLTLNFSLLSTDFTTGA